MPTSFLAKLTGTLNSIMVNKDSLKQTEIGSIPEDWEVVKLGDIINEVISGDWGNGKPSDKEELIKCKVVRGTDFSKLEKITFSDIPERFLKASSLEKRAIKSGDLLIEISGGSKDQPTGRVFYACDEILDKAVSPLMFTNFVKLIRVNEDIAHSEYAYRYWQYLYSSGRTKIYEKQTTNIRNFRYNDFLESEVISLPSLPEQQKIARVLSTIQRAVEQQDKIIGATKKLKRSLMQKLFTEGLNEEEPKETEIGLIAKSWEVVRLGEVCLPRKEIIQPAGEGRFKYIGLEYINSGETGLEHFGLDTEVRSSKNRFYKGDILYGKLRPYLDKAAIADFDGICSTDIIVIRATSSKAVTGYIMNLIHLPSFVSFATSTMTGVNHPRTSWKAISTFKIPLPPLPEQQEIGRILSTVDKKIEIEERRKATLKELFNTMLHKLMTGEIRVRDIEL